MANIRAINLKDAARGDGIHEIDFTEGHPTDTDIERYRKDGVVLIRRFFEPEAFRSVLDDIDQRIGLLERKNNISTEGLPASDVRSLSQRLIQLDTASLGAQSIIYDAMSKSPSMHALAAREDLIGLVRSFVNPPVAHHDRFILLMSLPEKTWHLAGWHQDWYYNDGPPDTITVYAPLQRTTDENGGLLFAPGEHKNGLLPHGEFAGQFTTKWHTIDPAAISKFPRIATAPLDAGDLFIFNSLVPHSAQVNLDTSIRFVINLRYHSLDDDAFIEDGWRIDKIERAREALSRRPLKETLT